MPTCDDLQTGRGAGGTWGPVLRCPGCLYKVQGTFGALIGCPVSPGCLYRVPWVLWMHIQDFWGALGDSAGYPGVLWVPL